MATHSSILPWRIPWTEEPGGLQPIGLLRVSHDWSNLACVHPILGLFPFHQVTLANIAPLKPSGKSYKQVKWLACQQTRGPKYKKDHKTCPRLCRTKVWTLFSWLKTICPFCYTSYHLKILPLLTNNYNIFNCQMSYMFLRIQIHIYVKITSKNHLSQKTDYFSKRQRFVTYNDNLFFLWDGGCRGTDFELSLWVL